MTLPVTRVVASRSFHSSQCLHDTPLDPNIPERKPRKPKDPSEPKVKKEKLTKLPKEKKQKQPKEKKEKTPVGKSVLQDSKLQHQLNEIENSQAVTLEDVERLRPATVPRDTLCDAYVAEHRVHLAKLTKSFSTEQLMHILELYDIHPTKSRLSKHSCAVLIMKQWGWPDPKWVTRMKTMVQEGMSTIAVAIDEALKGHATRIFALQWRSLFLDAQ